MGERKLKIAITGSEGLLGKEITNYLSKNHKVFKLDLELGHNLSDEKFVRNWFKKNKVDALVNCFALKTHSVLEILGYLFLIWVCPLAPAEIFCVYWPERMRREKTYQ